MPEKCLLSTKTDFLSETDGKSISDEKWQDASLIVWFLNSVLSVQYDSWVSVYDMLYKSQSTQSDNNDLDNMSLKLDKEIFVLDGR